VALQARSYTFARQDRILEANEGNNLARILVNLTVPPAAVADRYEEVDAKEPGAKNSPNLGRLISRRELTLSMNDEWDYFRFELGEAPGPGAFIRAESEFVSGDLDLWLLDRNLRAMGISDSLGNREQVSLEGLPPGAYYAVVMAYSGETPEYQLTFDPMSNVPPALAIQSPPPGEIWIEQAFETIPFILSASDPDGDPTEIALFIDDDHSLDKGTAPIDGYQHLSGTQGHVPINTAGLPLGRWFLYAKATDGAGETGLWAPGAIVLYLKGDVNFDGHVDSTDLKIVERPLCGRKLRRGLVKEWSHVLDMNRDRELDQRDLRLLRGIVSHASGLVLRG
jgi:hypothetical protein